MKCVPDVGCARTFEPDYHRDAQYISIAAHLVFTKQDLYSMCTYGQNYGSCGNSNSNHSLLRPPANSLRNSPTALRAPWIEREVRPQRSVLKLGGFSIAGFHMQVSVYPAGGRYRTADREWAPRFGPHTIEWGGLWGEL